MGRVEGLGDLSHASVVFSRDERFAYVFGRDGALTRVDILEQRITHRVMQAGNSIGGAISADGSLVVAQNYTPGGIKVFDAATLELLSDIPALMPNGERSRVVGLADLPQRRFIYSLFDAEAICIADCSNPRKPRVTTLAGIGRQPYDALLSPNGRHYIAGLFGEDGLAMVDLWDATPRARRILAGYGRGEKPLPVYKMPHLRGWAMAGGVPTYPPSAAMRCWSSIPPPGPRSAAFPSPASPCSSWRAPTAARCGSTSRCRTTTACRSSTRPAGR